MTKYSKTVTQKSTQEIRIAAYRKKLNSALKNNQTPKKRKPQEKTAKKRKKGEFDDSCISFAKEDSTSHFKN